MNCQLIYQQIFSYLKSRDLLRVASVSKLWREVCKKDQIASPRLEQYITNQKQHVIQKGKENFGYHTKFDNSVPQRQPLSTQNDNIRKPQPKEVSTDLNEVREKLLYTYERIKCPYCLSPSKKTDEWWECKKCQHVFCSVCQCRVDENHKTGQCSHKLNTENAKQISIGSKKSKDRLKRF
ncbi:uncharacterized protein LOC124447732 [Xenia sp. Carnegie-2017]|uniref:uncharacterized protein LOC124447732 n=1 Tax=Xenia sp. Carnegie-2017 TaxID=2897299 RepID=UPI001F050161|nr:uncharacterized protein LOC124447732 [Xenia sp. Carnegie-2017]